MAITGIGSVPIAGQRAPNKLRGCGTANGLPVIPATASSHHHSPPARTPARGAAWGRSPKAAAVTDGGFTVNSSSAVEAADLRRRWMVHGLARCARGPASPRIFGGSRRSGARCGVAGSRGGIRSLIGRGHDWPLLVDSASSVQVAVLRLAARDPWYFPTQVLEFGPG